MASLGAKVLQTRSVELGMVHNVPSSGASSFAPEDIGPEAPVPPGTIVCDEEEIVETADRERRRL